MPRTTSSPVDYIAGAIASAAPGPVRHLTNPHRTSLDTLIDHLRTAGYTLPDRPPLGTETFTNYVDYFARTGYLPKPPY